MCLPITTQRDTFHDGGKLSVTQILVAMLSDYRNRPENEPRDFSLAMIERRVLGELGYAALFVVALVESIVRPMIGGLLLLIGVVTTLFLDDYEIFVIGLVVGVTGCYQIDVGLRCLVALVKNIYRDRMQYEDLKLAVFETCD